MKDSMSVTEFKAKCLSLLEEVFRTGKPLTIVKRGQPIAQVIPFVPREHNYPQDSLKGTVTIEGDILEPVLPVDTWESDQQNMSKP